MKKIYYNANGYVCNRHPQNFSNENCSFMEVTDELYKQTLSTRPHYVWLVQNGVLTNVQYEPIPEDEQTEELRNLRNEQCFATVNRGQIWYDTLTFDQKRELVEWYQAWLDVTTTKQIPVKPNWIDGKANYQQNPNNQSTLKSWL